jgi:Holliday junction DNA helicase RuvA
MIASLKGTIKEVNSSFLVIDVNGVGFKVEGDFLGLKTGQDIDLSIHTHFSENSIRLFGFTNSESFELFKLLLTVPGVGPKSALLLLSNLGVESIKRAVNEGNPQMLKGKGIGLKIAQKVVIELASKFEKIEQGSIILLSPAEEKKMNEVFSALLELGFSKQEINNIKNELSSLQELSSEKMLRVALKLLKDHSRS